MKHRGDCLRCAEFVAVCGEGKLTISCSHIWCGLKSCLSHHPGLIKSSLCLVPSLLLRSRPLRSEAPDRLVHQLHQRSTAGGGHWQHHQRHAADHSVPDHRHGNCSLTDDVLVVSIHSSSVCSELSFHQDERNQILTTYLWVRQVWMDAFLSWKKEDYDGLDTIRIPSSYVWRPDIVLYNR